MDLEVTKENGEKLPYTFEKNKILIGRGKDADLRLDGDDISRKHLYLEVVDGKYFVEDLGAANGVFINQQRVPPNTRQEVQTFFAIQVGGSIFINILEQDDNRVAPSMDSPAYVSNRSKASASDKTSTRQLPNAKAKPLPRARVKEEGKKKNLGPYIMIALIVGAAGYYALFQMGDQEEAPSAIETPAVSPEEAKISEIKQKFEIQLTPGQRREKNRLEAAFSNICQTEEEKNICVKLRPEITDKEGAKVIPDQSKLIIFRNLETTVNTIWGGEFSKIPAERRYPFILSYLSIKYQKEFDFKVVEVIDYKLVEKVFIPLSSSEILRDGIQSVSGVEANEILEKAKETGDLTKFDQVLKSTHILGFFADPAELQKAIIK